MEVDDSMVVGNESLTFDRPVDHVKQVIELAKLEDSELYSFSQVVSFCPQLYGDEVKLIHVSKQMADSLDEGECVYLRGSEEENIVLCTKDKTYDFKEAETSNSLLVLPNLTRSKECIKLSGGERTLAWRNVSGVFFKYYELVEMRPRLQKLRTVLQPPLTESAVKDRNLAGKSFADLLECIQSSEEELCVGLKELEAVQFDCDWFVLEQEYQMKVLSYLLKLFTENSWPLDCVQKKDTLETLSELVNPEILSQVFDIYCTPMQGGTPDQFSLDKVKVSRFYGDFLLVEGSSFALDEFRDMWQKALPEGIKADISHLAGLALVMETGSGTSSSQTIVKRFPESSLPNTIQARLEVLFAAREKWSVADLTPYIQPLTTPKLNVNALLTKYARPVTVGGVKFFCAKHGK
jgi:sister chromatid cohesion protein DCC1